ncbi:MAG: hypothetical protein IKP64_11880 [Selenomonadaceae bacterium]|nr:hypothetical protein [Selenomonadaceae bacterium]MBR4384244.1 hypothetical protein [Selenomonadaceae bacterium]
MNEFIFEQCDVSADLDDCSKNFNRLQTRNEFVFDLQRFPDENPLIDDEPEEISYIISGGDVTISAGGAYTIESGFAGEIYVMTGDAVTLDGSGASSLTSAQIYTGTNAADLTINSVSISNPNASPIKFGSGGGTLTLVGENVFSTENFYAAAVNVGSGNVTIDGSGTLTATAIGYGAAVGSDYGSTSTPNLTVANGTFNLSSNYGAGLGSGFASQFGTISVTGGTINASATLGAGIGTGAGTSENAGSVAITGGGITATSRDGAGIGSGFEGAIENITIEGIANVDANSSGYGAGIGSGSTGGNESSVGNITIGGNASVVATSAQYGAGIGTGYARYNGMNMAGTISIGGDANVTATSLLNGLGIGAGYSDNVALNVVGTISLAGDASTAAKSAVVIENSDTTRTVTINGTELSGRQLTFIDGVQSNPISNNNSTNINVNESIAGATNVGKVDGSDDYIYLGGIGVISDYAGVSISSAADSVDSSETSEDTTTVTDETTGAKIRYATDYSGFGFDGYTLAISSSTGGLYVQNCKDKILAIADTSGNATTYVYSPTEAEVIYGNTLTKTEIIAGSDKGADVIFAGDGGSTVWGGTDTANDSLIGGKGHDEFLYVDGTGADVVTNYGGEDLIKINGTINGVNMFGDFALTLSNGSLTVANSQDRLITVADMNGGLLGYGYYSSTADTLDGSAYAGTQVLVGGAFGDNLIIAGNGGSSLWGNFGGVNTLIGGAGHDEFFYTPGSGIVFVQNANAFDTVNLVEVERNQIAGIAVTATDTTISFTDGGALNVQGVGLTYKLDGKNYVADSTTQNLVAV